MSAKIIITLEDDGSVSLKSEVRERVLILGLLEMSKEALLHPEPKQSDILVPSLKLVPGVGN